MMVFLSQSPSIFMHYGNRAPFQTQPFLPIHHTFSPYHFSQWFPMEFSPSCSTLPQFSNWPELKWEWPRSGRSMRCYRSRIIFSSSQSKLGRKKKLTQDQCLGATTHRVRYLPSVMRALLVSTLPSMNLNTARMIHITPLTMDTLKRKSSW